jgi:hypothetical protein
MKKDLEASDHDIRDMLGSLLYLIRFPSMDQDFFTTEVSTREILNKDEMLSVYRSFNGIKKCNLLTALMHFRNLDIFWDISKYGIGSPGVNLAY